MQLPRRGWIGWIEEHRRPIGAISVWLVVGGGGIGALVANAAGRSNGPATGPAAIVSGESQSPGATIGPSTGPSVGPSTGPGGSTGPGNGNNGGSQGPGTGPSTGPTQGPGNNNGNGNGNGGGNGSGPCVPTQPKASNGDSETGITTHRVTIGEIVTDSSQLPQQLRPSYEGLSAWANMVNRAGGICGRQVEIEYRNDFSGANTGPPGHSQAYQDLASQVFSFVATESLFDTAGYSNQPPYNPAFTDPNTGEFVPDVGGLSLGYDQQGQTYPRSQSNWHAGIAGSLSPTLTGGGQFHYLLHSSPGNKCSKGGVLFLNEPSGASSDQAGAGAVALRAKWGGGLGDNVNMYSQNLAAPEPAYEQTVQQMIGDGVDCVFTFADRQSNVNLINAEANQGVWPPSNCSAARKAADQCFHLTYMPFTAADEKFVQDAGSNGAQVSTWVPHVPLSETSNPAVREYLTALAQCNSDQYEGCSDGSAKPSSFSVIGFASGAMFGDALLACGGAPTRICVMNYLRRLQNYTAHGLMGPVTPFQCTKVDYGGNNWCWKWIFHNSVTLREVGPVSDGVNAFRRINPSSGFAPDTLHIVRGSPG